MEEEIGNQKDELISKQEKIYKLGEENRRLLRSVTALRQLAQANCARLSQPARVGYVSLLRGDDGQPLRDEGPNRLTVAFMPSDSRNRSES